MSGDYSRYIFDPTRDYHGVQLQQGRPLTDWDWNDATAQINRHAQAGRYDTFGPLMVPGTTPDAFALSIVAGKLLVGPGRLYVDGLLAENHGIGAAQWDSALAELRGSDPIDYSAQLLYPNPPPLPSPGPMNLVYIDVWQREVTAIEAPELIERALGVDTTTRIQTVWQVKLLDNVDSSVDCNTPLDQIPAWVQTHPPAGGRLTTSVGDPPQDDPCLIPPAGGYKGLENQLYRVEIHDGGGFGTATFKWSRNNASVVVRVSQLVTGNPNAIVVESTGRDKVLGFNDGDWVEITDDWRELNNLPGQMLRITIGGGVDDATRTIVFDDPVDTGLFPGATLEARNTRLKRWDQQGQVLLGDGTPYVDLDTTTNGLIKLPAAGTTIMLEAGVLVSFDLDTSNGGSFRSGDYWMFAARVAGAWLEPLDHAPPRGIHHHYATLGFTTLEDTPHNCPPHWPPTSGGDCCACTVCVSAAGHNDGSATIQQAIQKVLDAGGGTVCLEAGTFNVTQTIAITDAASLRLVGQGSASQLVASVTPAFQVDGARDLALRDFAVRLAADADGGVGVAVSAATVLVIDALLVRSVEDHTRDIGLQFGGAVKQCAIWRCIFGTATGLALGGADTETPYAGDVLCVADNRFGCSAYAIDAPQLRASTLELRCCGNVVDGAAEAGFRLLGPSADRHGRIAIVDNRLTVAGHGIVGGLDGLDVRDNEIRYHAPKETGDKPQPSRDGVQLRRSSDEAASAIDDVRITGNHIVQFPGSGIHAVTTIGDAIVKQNSLQRCGAGIALLGGGNGAVSVENNLVEDLLGTGKGNIGAIGVAAIGLPQVAIRANALARLGRNSGEQTIALGIVLQNCDRSTVDANSIADLAPLKEFKGLAVGVLVLEPFIDTAVHDNNVTRSAGLVADGLGDGSPWYAIGISGRMPSGDIKGLKGSEAAQFASDAFKAGGEVFSNLQVKPKKTPKSKTAADVELPRQRALVRANQLAGYGGQPLIALIAAHDGDCSGNQCHVQGKHGDKTAGVALLAHVLTVNSNRIAGNAPNALVMLAVHAATLGNTTTGQIRLNGAALPAPWTALNLTGV